VLAFFLNPKRDKYIKEIKKLLGDSGYLQLRSLELPARYWCLVTDPNGNYVVADDYEEWVLCSAEDAPPPEFRRFLVKSDGFSYHEKLDTLPMSKEQKRAIALLEQQFSGLSQMRIGRTK